MITPLHDCLGRATRSGQPRRAGRRVGRRVGRRFSLALCVALVLAGAGCTTLRPSDPTGAPAPTEPLRVMTFNIRYGTAPDGEDAWPRRRELVFRVIGSFAPTLLGVQEALRFQLDEIGSNRPEYEETGVARDDGAEQGEYSAILYDRRRLELLVHGTFWLSDTPHLPGSRSWGNNFARIVTWGRFRDRVTGAAFYAFNTHWDHESQPSRERSAALLLERIDARATPDPVLLMGDFNAGEDNPAFQALLAPRDEPNATVRLYDTFRAVHPRARDTGTYHAFTGDRTGARIDAILASPEWHTHGAAIITFGENGRFPSDHFPVTATVALSAAPATSPGP